MNDLRRKVIVSSEETLKKQNKDDLTHNQSLPDNPSDE